MSKQNKRESTQTQTTVCCDQWYGGDWTSWGEGCRAGVNCMGTGGDLPVGGGHTMTHSDDAPSTRALDPYVLLLSSTSPTLKKSVFELV